MKKFITKSLPFVVPFLLLHFVNVLFYNQEEGGLVRLGYLYDNPSPMSGVKSKFNLKNKTLNVSELDLKNEQKFDVFNIGDSFSNQDSLSYFNYLANNGFSVLNLDSYIHNYSSVQALAELVNADFFDKVKPEFVVLETVEREFTNRCLELDFFKTKPIDSIIARINTHKNTPKIYSNKFFADRTLKIPLVNLEYLMTDKPKYAQTYKVKTLSDKLFSKEPEDLLFYENDLYIENKFDTVKIRQANEIMNQLSKKLTKKGIKLILLIAPDKYDLYYPWIQQKSKYKQTVFFDYFKTLPKNYIYTDSFDVLTLAIKNGTEDVYYYDDTHWSPVGAELIALQLKLLIEKNH